MRHSSFVLKNRDIFFYKTLERALFDCESVLDVGCGNDSPIGKIAKPNHLEGIDIFAPSLKTSKKNQIHDRYKSGDIRHLKKFYKEQSFDAVIALDVIEHFKKKDAKKIIKSMEKIAREKVILLTPNGFYPQDEIGGNPYQKHLSGWSIGDLRGLGYTVYGLRGLKYIRGDYANIKYKPWLLWGTLSFLSEPLLHKVPQLSYHLFAIKNIYVKK